MSFRHIRDNLGGFDSDLKISRSVARQAREVFQPDRRSALAQRVSKPIGIPPLRQAQGRDFRKTPTPQRRILNPSKPFTIKTLALPLRQKHDPFSLTSAPPLRRRLTATRPLQRC